MFKIKQRSREEVSELLEEAAIRFFQDPKVQEILRSEPETSKMLDEALKRQQLTENNQPK
ncbi:MAG: hypothetical protein OXI88_23080 [Gammaproteobacteria bacterium]|nr:hypothetical protein [Gammaproteobacteria bacterium]MDE0283411.1 hypothetical protein [Gammaproteobacteria bacterium]MDE0514652.1 hypothetical protein [Gammaproteobacteria bacterium]